MITEAPHSTSPRDVLKRLAETVDMAWEAGVGLSELAYRLQRDFIIRGLEQAGGNQLLLAETIGMHRNTLARKMAWLGVPVPEKRRVKCALRK